MMLGNLKMGQGIKRKLETVDLKCLNSQRQLILDISFSKLNLKSSKRVEPPLLRPVLILNTLKLIENQLIQEDQETPTTACSIPEVDPNSTVIDFLPEHNETSKISDIFEQNGPLPSFDTFVGNRIPTHQDLLVDKYHNYYSSPMEASHISYHSPLRLDEIFNELDLVLNDQDMFSEVADGTKLTSLSAEVLNSFPNTDAAFSCESSYKTLSNANILPFCKSETAFDDLDNIIQILVGS